MISRYRFESCHPQNSIADMMELVDMLDLESSAVRCESSSLSIRTIVKRRGVVKGRDVKQGSGTVVVATVVVV